MPVRPHYLLALLLLTRVCSAQPGAASVGAVLELSGPFASFGAECRQGLDLALSRTSVTLVPGDAAGKPVEAAAEMRRIATSKATRLIICQRSSPCMAMAPLASEMQIPLIATAGHPSLIQPDRPVFRAWPSATQEGAALAAEAEKLKLKKAAVLTLQEDYTQALTDSFKRAVEASGGALVFEESLPPGTADIQTTLARVRSANPDLIFVNLGGGTIGLTVRKIREAGISATLFSNFRARDKAEMTQGGGSMSEVVIVEAAAGGPKFRDRLQQLFPEATPSSISFSCYIAATWADAALSAEDGRKSTQSLTAALDQVASIDSLDGPLSVVSREVSFPIKLHKISER